MSRNKLPKKGLILEYQSVFGEPPPENRYNFISNTTKLELIGIICQINNLLSPRLSARFDYSLSTQKKILAHLLRIEPDQRKKDFMFSFLIDDVIFFSRSANLWAITEVLNLNIPDDQVNSKISSSDLWGFLLYYLCINSESNKIKYTDDSEGSRVEKINHSILAFNEYFEDIDPVHTLNRGVSLIKYISSSEDYGISFKEYINAVSGLSIEDYLVEIAKIYFSGHSEGDEFRFYFKLETPMKIFESFSIREIPIREKNNMEALHIRKSPFYKIGDNQYLMLDDKFLIEKSYELIIWEFLFEIILTSVTEPKERVNKIKKYKGFIGKFFESYINKKIQHSFHFLKHPQPKMFDDLLIEGVEYGDLYIRHNKKIILGEVKSSGIPSKSKYGETISELYENDKEKFFKTHGLYQLIQNLQKLIENPTVFDAKLNLNKRLYIYPVIVTSERSLIVGLFIQLFNEEFNRKFNRENYPSLLINPLLILHVSDIEFLEEYLHNKSINIFEVLDKHFRKFPFIAKLSLSYSYLPPKHGKHVIKSITSYFPQ